jgi:flagellar hook-associated protein 3 FlgL
MPYRVTNSMMVSNYNRNQNAAQVRMNTLQTQLATQRKITRLSDDPVNVVKSLNARSRLYDIEQYQKNLEDGKAWLTQTESALSELNELIKRAGELAVQAANDSNTDEDRTAIANEIMQLRDQISTLANSTMGDKFIFGGYNVSSPPFVFNPGEATFSFDSDNIVNVDNTGVVMYNYEDYQIDMSEDMDIDDPRLQYIRYEINIGLEFDISISGASFLGYGAYPMSVALQEGMMEMNGGDGVSNNVYTTFNELLVVLSALSDLNAVEGDGAEILHKNIHPYIGRLQTHQKNVLAQMADVGGRIARMDLMLDRYAKDEINYTQMKSDVEDLDLAEALMWFSMAEAVYRASLGVGGRILTPTLVDFLR